MKKQLGELVLMSDLGPPSYLLRIEVPCSTKGYYLSRSYKTTLRVRELLILGWLQHLWILLHAPLEDPSQYLGNLIYLTITRPDIAHAVHILNHFGPKHSYFS